MNGFERNGVPLYMQVASVLRGRIASGYWRVGTKIPTARILGEELRVALVTVRQALEILKNDGLLSAKAGRGTFVSRWRSIRGRNTVHLPGNLEAVRGSIGDYSIKNLKIDDRAEPPAISPEEGKLAEKYVCLQSDQYCGRKPMALVRVYVVKDIFDREKDRLKEVAALVAILDMDDVCISEAYQVVTVGIADSDVARRLRIDLGKPTADCRFVISDAEGVAIYVADVRYPGDLISLECDLLDKMRDTSSRRSLNKILLPLQ